MTLVERDKEMKFEWNEMLLNVLYVCLTVIMPILVRYIIKYITTVIATATEKIEDAKLRDYVYYATDVVNNCVLDVCQTYVDSLKSAGKFDKEAQVTAKQMALDKAVALITSEAKQAVSILYGDFNAWIDSIIEASVRENKLSVNK